MPNTFKKHKLGDVADIQNGYAFGAKEFSDKGVPIIKIKNIVPPYISFAEAQYYNLPIDSRLEKYIIKEDDILISMTGSTVNQMSSAVGKIGRYKFDYPALLNQRVGKLYLTKPDMADYNYLYYYISRYDVQYNLALNATGSANQANISPAQIKDIDIELPPLPEQTAIAEILSALDDKIELNLQTNKTLEEMANALYKHWFVDFGPFQNGKFLESELGMIPEGWEVKPYYQIAKYINGTSIKQNQITEPNKGKPIVKIAELKQGITEQTKWSNFEFDEKYIFNTSDLLFSWSGNPHTSIDIFIWDKMESILNQHIFKVIPELYLEKPFVYFSLKYYMDLFITLATRKQTTGLGHFTNEDLKNNYIIVPSISAHKEYNSIASNYFELIYKNLIENQTLKQTRDYLLPKLISGEIRVKDAAQKLKEVL